MGALALLPGLHGIELFYCACENKILLVFAGNVPPNELQIYTWMDATLKEITSLVREVGTNYRFT